jgi:hypothetical protein
MVDNGIYSDKMQYFPLYCHMLTGSTLQAIPDESILMIVCCLQTDGNAVEMCGVKSEHKMVSVLTVNL